MISTAERVRFTISVEAEVYEAFADLAHSSGVSLSRCIGDWLRDTAEAAQMTTIKVNEARRSPEEVVRAYRRLMAEEAQDILENGRFWRGPGAAGGAEGVPVRRERQPAGVAGRQALPAKPAPPSSNTGGKSPGKTPRPL